MEDDISSYKPEDQTNNTMMNQRRGNSNYSYNSNNEEYDPFVKDDKNLMDSIVESGTFSLFTLLLLLCLLFIFVADGVEITLMNIIIIPIIKKYELGSLSTEITSSFIFLGAALGSAIGTQISKKVGSALMVKISLAGVVIFHLLMALILNLAFFIICRVIIGFLLGVIIIVCLNLLNEYISVRHRKIFLMIVLVLFTVGHIIVNSVAIRAMPQLQEDNLRSYMLWLTFFPGGAFLISLFLLQDSPSQLILKGTDESTMKGYKILDSMAKRRLTDEEKRKIVYEVKESSKSKETNGNVGRMFSGKYSLCSILLIVLYFFYAWIFHGFLIISELTLEKKIRLDEGAEDKYSNRDLIINQNFICLGLAVGFLLGGILLLIKLGRRIFLMIFTVLAACTYFPLPYGIKAFQILSPFAIGFGSLFGYTVMVYTIENYPPVLRDVSTIFYSLIFRLGSFLGQFTYLALFWTHYKLPYIASSGFLLVCFAASFFLPLDSHGIPVEK